MFRRMREQTTRAWRYHYALTPCDFPGRWIWPSCGLRHLAPACARSLRNFTSKMMNSHSKHPFTALLLLAALHLASIHLHATTLYVSVPGSGTVEMFDPNTGQALGDFATGLFFPTGLAFDAAGNLFVAELGTNSIFKIQPDGTKSLFTAGDLNRPMDLAFGPGGDLFVANDGTSTIIKITPAGVVSVLGNGDALNHPTSVASDFNGNVYAANTGSGAITKTTPAGLTSSFGPALDTPHGLDFDGAGTLFVVEHLSSAISKIGSDGTATPFVSGLAGGYPSDLAFDESDNLFVAYNDTDLIGRITPGGVETTFMIGGSPFYLAIGPDPIPEPGAATLLAALGIVYLCRRPVGQLSRCGCNPRVPQAGSLGP